MIGPLWDCPFGLIFVRATVMLGVCLVGLMSIGLISTCPCVAVWSGYCPVGLLSGRAFG